MVITVYSLGFRHFKALEIDSFVNTLEYLSSVSGIVSSKVVLESSFKGVFIDWQYDLFIIVELYYSCVILDNCINSSSVGSLLFLATKESCTFFTLVIFEI